MKRNKYDFVPIDPPKLSEEGLHSSVEFCEQVQSALKNLIITEINKQRYNTPTKESTHD